jgi:hypothetical protein
MTDAAFDPFADPDLDQSLEDDDDRAGYRIGGDREASWALRKLWRAEREIARLKRNHQDTVEILDEQLQQALGGPERDARFFEGVLGDYHRRLVAAGEADKTYRLPAGELHARKAPDSLEVPDEALALDLFEAFGRVDLLNIKTTVDKKAAAGMLAEWAPVAAFLEAVTGARVPPLPVRIKTGDVRYSAKAYDIGLVE